jgi:heme exporter protein D
MNMVMLDDGPAFSSLAPFGLVLIALLGYPLVRRWRAVVFVLLPLAMLCSLPLLTQQVLLREVLRDNAFQMDASLQASFANTIRQQAIVYGALFLAAVLLPSLAATSDRGRTRP